jgi:hypothetical protein
VTLLQPRAGSSGTGLAQDSSCRGDAGGHFAHDQGIYSAKRREEQFDIRHSERFRQSGGEPLWPHISNGGRFAQGLYLPVQHRLAKIQWRRFLDPAHASAIHCQQCWSCPHRRGKSRLYDSAGTKRNTGSAGDDAVAVSERERTIRSHSRSISANGGRNSSDQSVLVLLSGSLRHCAASVTYCASANRTNVRKRVPTSLGFLCGGITVHFWTAWQDSGAGCSRQSQRRQNEQLIVPP